MTDRVAVMTGGCQCGAVRYAIYASVRAGICHCRMCQKAVGGPFFAWAMTQVDDFAWTRGTPAVFRSSSSATRGFCAQCGTPLSFQYDKKPGSIDVSLGSLDRPGDVTPSVVMGTERVLPWCDGTMLKELPAHPTGTLDPPEDLSRIGNFQHPDHDTPDGWRAPRG